MIVQKWGREGEGFSWLFGRFLLGLETLTAIASPQVANHLVATTESFTATTCANVLLHNRVLGVHMATKIVLALKVQFASLVRAREREQVRVDRHVGL